MFVEEPEAVILCFFFREDREYIVWLDPDITTRDDQFAPGPADCDKHEVFDLKLTDFVPDNRRTLLGNYLKDGPSRDLGKLLELGILGPVIEA